MKRTLDPSWPRDPEPGWFERSSWAYYYWKIALEAYWDARARIGSPWNPNPDATPGDPYYEQALADSEIHRARAEYRHQILGWYRKLCLPLKPGHVVPKSVVELQFEQWDLDGCDVGDAVNL